MGFLGIGGGYGEAGDAAEQQRDAAQRLANTGWASSFQARGVQQAANAPLYQFAMGTAPTAADYTAAAQREANARAAQSQAASARGGNVGLAQYQAANNAAAGNQAAAFQATQANLAGQQGWWNQYLQNLQAQRAGDNQAMATQAGLAGQAQAGLASMYGANRQASSQETAALVGAGGALGAAGIKAA